MLAGAVIVAGGSGSMYTLADPLAAHDGPLCTVTARATEPLGPGEKVIARVPAPETSVPFVTVQTYVAPRPASGAAAVPVDEAHTLVGAVTCALGIGAMSMFADADAEQSGAFCAV